MIVPLFVGREKSIRALEDVMENDRQILLATQKDASDDDPPPMRSTARHVANVLQLLKLPDNTVKVLVEGVSRMEIRGFTERTGLSRPRRSIAPEEEEGEIETRRACRARWSRNSRTT
jgi:ATP-dependent Lon protease